MDIVTIDFEASCLPRHGRSYPIEVGIADGRETRSWLIRPHPLWAGWDWSDEAEALHGLDRADLIARGLSAGQVFAEMADAVAGRRLVADSGLDQYWLDTLAEAAGQPPALRIEHVSAILDEFGVSTDQIESARTLVADCGIERHRAASDALWLSRILLMLRPAARYAVAA